MNVFDEVVSKADIIRVCDMLGIKLNRSNQAICPLPGHNEKTPSFSVHQGKQMFYCFGCNCGGNCINLVSKMYNCKPLEAAKIINRNLGLGVIFKEYGVKIARGSDNFRVNPYEERQKRIQEMEIWTNNTMIKLCEYLKYLRIFKEFEDFDNDLFVEALDNIDLIEYDIDTFFINGTMEDKIWFRKNKRKELNKIETRLRLFGAIS